MIPLTLLVTYIIVVLYVLVWCENALYKAGDVLQSGGRSRKRGTFYKAGDVLQSGRVYKAGGSTKREGLQSGRVYKAGGSHLASLTEFPSPRMYPISPHFPRPPRPPRPPRLWRLPK